LCFHWQPDGRVYTITNRRCGGERIEILIQVFRQRVDLNRNYDFLWHSGIGTSDPSSEIFKGTAPNSEPETKNVIHLVNTYNNIICVLDIHSYSELILYPWGDDETQTHDPGMNFLNPVYDGVRGHLGDSDYREYIHKKDLDSYIFMGNKIKNAISSLRGKNYKVIQSMNLYPTTVLIMISFIV
jgi:hypothetical protein